MNGLRDEFLFFIVLLWLQESIQNVVGQAGSSPFSIRNHEFLCEGNLLSSGNATTTNGSLKLTGDHHGSKSKHKNTVGVALYNKPVQLRNLTTDQVASLSIAFSFKIENHGTTPSNHGEGMAFVMFAKKRWMGYAGSNLGAYGSHGRAGCETLAVEFDTNKNSGIDDSDNHMGIDITSTMSDKVQVLPFRLEGEQLYAWVDYNPVNSTGIIAVRVHNTSNKPEQPLLTYKRDLRDVFRNENVWVGFSGSNGDYWSVYTVYNLSLNSSFPSFPVSPPPPPLGNSPPPTSTTAPVQERQKPSRLLTFVFAYCGAAGVAGVVAGGCILLLYARRKRRIIYHGDTPLRLHKIHIAGLPSGLKRYTYDELCAATADFSAAFKLGAGGFGAVYRGSIPGSKPELEVAVKKLSSESKQGEKEFVSEVSTIGMLRHTNIVQLLGWCCDAPGECLLVYEFLPNGSLDRHLYPSAETMSKQPGKESVLSWEKRFKILCGLAAALEYLHDGWRQKVIHRDVKSSNVMLDDDFNAKLGDFGLARMVDHFRNPPTTAVIGTRGYMAPEAFMTGNFTAKTDVYSFGAVCMEIACGRKVANLAYPTEEVSLVDHVWRKLSEDGLLSLVDVKLEGNYVVQQVETVLLLGLLCCHPNPDERPTMDRVVEILAGEVAMPPIPLESYCWYSGRDRKEKTGSGTDA